MSRIYVCIRGLCVKKKRGNSDSKEDLAGRVLRLRFVVLLIMYHGTMGTGAIAGIIGVLSEEEGFFCLRRAAL